MSFTRRAALSDKVAELINREIFAKAPFAVQHFGVERHLSQDFIRALYDCMDNTGKFARYAPDNIAVHRPTRASFFVEYKTMQRPAPASLIRDRATNRYAQLEEGEWQRAKRELTPETWGVIERDALDNYLLLAASLMRVCVIVAVSYHPELLLSEWADHLVVVYRQPDTIQAEPGIRANFHAAGSGTPYANIHLGRMRTLEEFLRAEFGFEASERIKRLSPLVADCLNQGNRMQKTSGD